MENIAQLTAKQISTINSYLKEHQHQVLSPAYIEGLTTEFGREMQANDDFLFRGRFIKTHLYRHTVEGKAVQHALAVSSCSTSYTRTEVLLLDEDFQPIKIMHTDIT